MKIIAIRHGETATNAAGLITGWNDEDLTEKGVAQAQEAATTLKAEFRFIVSSPLRRAQHTAEIVAAAHPCKIVLDPNLRERNFGRLNGKTWEEIEAESGKPMRSIDIEQMAYDYRPWDGECVAEVTARVQEFLRQAPEIDGGRDLVAVTHGGIIKLLYLMLAHQERRPISNCSIHEFTL
jgi:2,3-bisphosphoglycerate-dependent phosphoglycerate mutase